ncbi:MAG: PEP-CTERM sorting domain-containing protein [Planctomycetota bacterium]
MRFSLLFATLVLLIDQPFARAEVVMDVYASPAPNFTASPSWNGYLANALNSLENDLGSIGDRSLDPTAYEVFADGATIGLNELIVSPFNSWRGVANPSAPFDNEFGNRVHFGVHIVGDGTMRFRLEDLSYEMSSTDSGNRLGFSGSFAGGSYSGTRIGIDYGADMAKGGGDDTIIDSGAATQFVDELIYVGVGNAFDASPFSGSDQERIDQVLSEIGPETIFDFTGSYSLSDSTGASILAAGATTISVVPEPTAVVALLALTGTLAFRRRRS